MNYKPLGRSGIKVSEVCLGTMTMGREADEKTSTAMVDHYLAEGGNFVDTADIYGKEKGATEELVGKILKGRRSNVVLATKAGFGKDPNNKGMSRFHLLNAVDASLRRLQTEWVDVFYLHIYDSITPFEETLDAIDMLVKAGKVRYFGISNFSAWHIMKFLSLSELHSLPRCIVYQPQYNLLEREIEREFVPLCRAEGLGMVCWAPLAGGLLTCKYKAKGAVEGRLTRVAALDTDSWDNRVNDFTLHIVETLKGIAENRKVPCSQVALNWLRAKPWVTSPTIGARTFEQYKDNFDCLGWNLTREEEELLDKASERPAPYPYKFVDRLQRR